jgi:hypothetical protein
VIHECLRMLLMLSGWPNAYFGLSGIRKKSTTSITTRNTRIGQRRRKVTNMMASPARSITVTAIDAPVCRQTRRNLKSESAS